MSLYAWIALGVVGIDILYSIYLALSRNYSDEDEPSDEEKEEFMDFINKTK